MVKNEKNDCYISLFCEKREGIKALKNEVEPFRSELRELLNKNIYIFFHNIEEALEKIIEIYSSSGLIKAIDVRV